MNRVGTWQAAAVSVGPKAQEQSLVIWNMSPGRLGYLGLVHSVKSLKGDDCGVHSGLLICT